MADIFDFYVYDDRSIRYELAEPIMLEDKDVTQFRFRIPKVLNNIDMSSWEWWFIFVNAKKVKYTSQLVLTDDEDDPENFSVATYTVGYGFSGYVGSVSFSIEALNVLGEDIVNEWHTRTYNTTVTDTLQGSRAVIPEPEGQSGTGLTEEIRQALLQLARKVAYIDEHGQTYYNNLYDALYAIQAITVSPTRLGLRTLGATSQLIGATVPSGGTITWTSSNPAVATVSDTGLVTSVSYGTATITAASGGKSATCSVIVAQAMIESVVATYTQSGTVYDSDSLDSLKPDLIVTAYFDNQTSAVVTDYTLSGILTAGTSIITVDYAGFTDTFEVNVTASPTYVLDGLIHRWDAINNTRQGHDASVNVWEDLVGTNDLTVNNFSNITWLDNAVQFAGVNGTRFIGSEASTDASGKTVEVVFSESTARTEAICSMFHNTSNVNGAWGKIALYSDGTFGVKGGSDKTYTGVAIADFHSISASYDSAISVNAVYANAVAATLSNNTHSLSTSSANPSVGGSPTSYDYAFSGKVHAIRIYDRILTAEEVAQNYAVDVSRFNLG